VRDELRRISLFASGVGDLTRHRAEQIAKELVKSGEVRRDQAGGWTKMLLDASRENRQELIRFLRSEIRNQVQGLGLATKDDLERMERRLARVEAASHRAAVKKPVARRTAAKTTVAKNTIAGKTAVPQPPSTGSETDSRGAGPS
jgi:polyhydroxyalkanoate synthesis regulator phasin